MGAPKMAEEEYAGAQDSAKGIIGMLEVCKTDFERTSSSTVAAEEAAETDFGKFKEETEESIESKMTIKQEKSDSIVEVKADMVEQKDELAGANRRSSTALAALDKMRELCDLDGESATNRNKQRLAEIESLKEAQEILDNWKDTSG